VLSPPTPKSLRGPILPPKLFVQGYTTQKRGLHGSLCADRSLDIGRAEHPGQTYTKGAGLVWNWVKGTWMGGGGRSGTFRGGWGGGDRWRGVGLFSIKAGPPVRYQKGGHNKTQRARELMMGAFYPF